MIQPPTGWPRVAGVTLTLAVTLCVCQARADAKHEHNCTREDVEAAEPAPMPLDRDPSTSSAALMVEALRPLPPAPARIAEPPPPPRRAWTARFVDSFDVRERLRSLSRLRILRLWDSARVTVFFGLDHAGHAGLHVQQQDPHDFPPLRLRQAPVEVPPLRPARLVSM